MEPIARGHGDAYIQKIVVDTPGGHSVPFHLVANACPSSVPALNSTFGYRCHTDLSFLSLPAIAAASPGHLQPPQDSPRTYSPPTQSSVTLKLSIQTHIPSTPPHSPPKIKFPTQNEPHCQILLPLDRLFPQIRTGIKGNLDNGNKLTNREVLAALDASVNMLPYVYDTFEWDHCLDAGIDFDDAWETASDDVTKKNSTRKPRGREDSPTLGEGGVNYGPGTKKSGGSDGIRKG